MTSKTRPLAVKLTATAALCTLVGILIIELTHLFAPRYLQNYYVEVAVAGLAFLLVSGAFFLYAKTAIAPVGEIIQFLQHANLNRLGARLEISTQDEIEVLSRSINMMMKRIDGSMKRIQRMSFVDTVTELPNLERIKQESEAAIRQAQANNQTGAFISLDVDKFIRIQSTLGKNVGEELLGLVSKRIAAAVRASDRIVRLQTCQHKPSLLARTQTSEFAILLPDVKDPTEAGKFAQLVAASLRQPFETENHNIVLGASIGIAVFPHDGETGEEILRSAELAMNHARNAGGGRIMYFTRKLNQRALDKLVLENEIRQGIENNQFVPYFQPKVDLGSGRIAGCEALVRWVHPKLGLVSPAKFIPAAEEANLIGPLGDIVMRESARYAAEWLRRGIAVRVAVNVSTAQFNDDDFTRKVVNVIQEANLPASLFELEITESIAMSDPDRVQRLLEPLRLMGIKIAIDDFGTGHSNLASLTSLPFDVFKIDQSFVNALGKDKHAPALIETIIAMAGGLNYETVAEGVETKEQAQFLKARGATLGQGYLFGAPMPGSEFEEFARHWALTGGPPKKEEAQAQGEEKAA